MSSRERKANFFFQKCERKQLLLTARWNLLIQLQDKVSELFGIEALKTKPPAVVLLFEDPSQTWINGKVVFGVKWGSVHCGNPLGNKRAANLHRLCRLSVIQAIVKIRAVRFKERHISKDDMKTPVVSY